MDENYSSSSSSDYSFTDDNDNTENSLRSSEIFNYYQEIETTTESNIVYDPSSDEAIICIELINNNKIYINYEYNWKINDVSKL